MTHAAALYPGLFEMGCEMAREGVTRSLAREIALEACSVAGKAMAGDADALTDGTLVLRVKREVRSLVFASNREHRRGRDRDEGPGSCRYSAGSPTPARPSCRGTCATTSGKLL